MISENGYKNFLNGVINKNETIIDFNTENVLKFYCSIDYYLLFKQLMSEGYVADIKIKSVYPEVVIVGSEISDVRIYNNYCAVELCYKEKNTNSVDDIENVFRHNQIIDIFEFNKYKNFIQENCCSIEIIGCNKFRILFPESKIKSGYRYFAVGNDNCTRCKYYDYNYHRNVETCSYENTGGMMYQSEKYICDRFEKNYKG